jgi:hypothetical protein
MAYESDRVGPKVDPDERRAWSRMGPGEGCNRIVRVGRKCRFELAAELAAEITSASR